MATNFSTAACAARQTACYITTSTAAGASVDGQSGFGLLVIGTSSLSGATGVLCTVTLQKPSFSVGTKQVTLLGVPLAATPSSNGTAALAELRDSGSNTVASGLTVTTTGGGGDIIVSTTSFLTTVPVSVTSGTITTS